MDKDSDIGSKERGEEKLKSHFHSKKGSLKTRCWKVKHERRKMVLRVDVPIGAISGFLRRTVVRCFCGEVVILSSLLTWIDANWLGVVGYRLNFYTLS
jgi:hypothetical protein